MWNPFSTNMNESNPPFPRRPSRPKGAGPAGQGDPPAESQEERRFHSDIAEIELMGQVAVATFTVSELTQDQGVEHLAELLQVLNESGAKHYVLDIQNIQFMDSMCLGCLVESLNVMGQTGGRIALANGEQTVQQLFRITRLDRVFPICRDVMAAINAVEREAA